METKTFAQIVLRSLMTPLFTTAEVADMLYANPVTIRTWLRRGYLKLQGGVRPGTGKTMLFSPLDFVSVMVFSQASELTIPPGTFANQLARQAMGATLNQLHLIAGTKDYEDICKRDFEEAAKEVDLQMSWDGFKRYIIAIYNVISKAPAIISANNFEDMSISYNSLFIAIDCKDLAEKALSLLLWHKDKFASKG